MRLSAEQEVVLMALFAAVAGHSFARMRAVVGSAPAAAVADVVVRAGPSRWPRSRWPGSRGMTDRAVRRELAGLAGLGLARSWRSWSWGSFGRERWYVLPAGAARVQQAAIDGGGGYVGR